MNGYSPREHGPVFEMPNEPRSVLSRLTPLAWVLLTAAGVGIGVAMFILIVNSPVPWPALRQSAAKASHAPSPTAAAFALVLADPQAGAVTATPWARPSATVAATSTPAPTHTPAPTATPAATITPAASTPPERERGEAAWKSDMVLTDGGAWMASARVVSDTQRVVQDYFAALRAHKTPADARRDLIEGQDEFLALYFSASAFDKVKRDLSAQETVAQYQSGLVDVAVLRYSEDGLSADVMVRQRGWTVRAWQLAGLTRWTQQRLPDQDAVWQVRYTPESGWKVTSIVTVKAAAPVRAVRKPVVRKKVVRTMPKAAPTVAAPPAPASAIPAASP